MLPLPQTDEDAASGSAVSAEKPIAISAEQKPVARDKQEPTVRDGEHWKTSSGTEKEAAPETGVSVTTVGKPLSWKMYKVALVGQLLLALVVFGVFRYVRSKANTEKDKQMDESAGR